MRRLNQILHVWKVRKFNNFNYGRFNRLCPDVWEFVYDMNWSLDNELIRSKCAETGLETNKLD